MLTPEGAALLWQLAAGRSQDTLEGWRIVVSDGSQEFLAETTSSADGAEVVFTATVGQDDANFEWAKREIRSRSGVIVDLEDEDNGRKAQGQEWQIAVTLSLAGQ